MAAETGHFPTRAYIDQQGVIHLNGTALQFDESGNTLSSSVFVFPGATFVPGSFGTLAAAGNSQGTAAAIVTATVAVTGADSTKGVLLPTPTVLGQEVTVVNTVSGQTLKVYPDSGGTGGTINGGSANAAATLASAKGATYVCTGLSPTAWWSASN